MAETFQLGAGRALFQATVAFAAAPLAAALALATYDPLTEIGAWSAAALAAGSGLVLTRQAFDRRAVLEIRPDGVFSRRMDETVPWEDLDGVWLRRTKSRLFLVVPADTLELVLLLNRDADYWGRGRAWRRFRRIRARLTGDWELAISLNGLGRRAAARLSASLKAAAPDIARPTETIRRRTFEQSGPARRDSEGDG